ncbi:hypothetical protein DMB90_25365 [Raoultella planticola]|uniref:Uncharacterized protein n=1 Tax=Raoultella planticola TaxID=575 RepID=A0A5P6AAT4_RAOPL|nr:hypothetical protein DMB90_25365 [Raoultella planticola]
MLKRDTGRHAAKAMLKQSGCYSITLMYCMYAEEFTLQAEENSPAVSRHRETIRLHARMPCSVGTRR